MIIIHPFFLSFIIILHITISISKCDFSNENSLSLRTKFKQQASSTIQRKILDEKRGCKEKSICKPLNGIMKCKHVKICSLLKLMREIKNKTCPQNRKYPPTKYLIAPYVDDDGYDLGEISYVAFSDYTNDSDNSGRQHYHYAYVASDKKQTSLKLVRFEKNKNNSNGSTNNNVGNVVAVLKLNNITNDNIDETDWEDISLGPCSRINRKPCIYIANTGGNNDDRDVLQIYKMYEPDLVSLNLNPDSPDLLNISAITINYSYGEGFLDKYNDAETLFVDWKGDRQGGHRGDIYIVTKHKDPYCDARVGKIPASIHSDLLPGESTDVYSMEAVMSYPPNQGNITCEDAAYRPWTGGDMSRDGRLITLRREDTVFFYPRLKRYMSVIDVLSEGSCSFVSSTSNGLPDENQFESVGFVGGSKKGFAELSECDNNSDCHVPVYFYNLERSIQKALPDANFCWKIITYDTFENSSDNNYNEGSEVSRSDDESKSKCGGNCACTGDWAMKMLDNSGVDSSFYHKDGQSCISYTHLRVSFQFMWSRSEAFDAFYLEISIDDGEEYIIVYSWALQSDAMNHFIENEKCYEDSIILDAKTIFGFDFFTDQTKLRFRSSANGGNDSVYIDEIKFEGADINSCDMRSRSGYDEEN